MFNKKRLKNLVESDRYKNSNYQFQKINGDYAIKNKSTERYVDLKNGGHEWVYGTTYTNDCLGSISDIISVFNFLHPIVKPLDIENIF